MWVRGLAELANGLTNLLYPHSCLICGAGEPHDAAFRHGLCSSCHAAVTADTAERCPRCAATVGPHTDVSAGCPACRDLSVGFETAVRLGPYEGRLREAILRMKSAGGEPLAEMLGRVFAERHLAAFKSAGIDLVVPVPLHWRRRWVRGYNQAEAVARELARLPGLPLLAGCLRRVSSTAQHAQPSATARRENIRGAFRHNPRASVASRTVLLVDDVMTTGSTVGEAARVLKQAGAAKVVVAVLARR